MDFSNKAQTKSRKTCKINFFKLRHRSTSENFGLLVFGANFTVPHIREKHWLEGSFRTTDRCWNPAKFYHIALTLAKSLPCRPSCEFPKGVGAKTTQVRPCKATKAGAGRGWGDRRQGCLHES
jgi:hypothetical protein